MAEADDVARVGSQDLRACLDVLNIDDESGENPITLALNNCGYYDIEILKPELLAQSPRQSALHINIQSLPAKYNQLKVLVDRLEGAAFWLYYVV